MTKKNKKHKKEWKDVGWSIGSETSQEKRRDNAKYTIAGKKGYKNASGKPGKKEHERLDHNNETHQRSNVGWLFYKDYYHGINFQEGQPKDIFKTEFESKNKNIASKKLSQYWDEVNALKLDFQTIQWFELSTEYPGLVTGLGSPHETRKDGEYKLGFHFDHTTGLPTIPGSSVKGVIRAAFKKSSDYIKYLLSELFEKNGSMTEIDIEELEKEIFDGEGCSTYQRDIFYDAVMISSENKGKVFLADDFITPHPNEFKDPIPLQFLKILPAVTFRFQFRLVQREKMLIPVQTRLNLFKRILVDLGIGAKTNVGYGKFKKIHKNQYRKFGGNLEGADNQSE